MTRPGTLEAASTWTRLRMATAVLALVPALAVEVSGQMPAPPTRATPWDSAIVAGVLLGRPDQAQVAGSYDDWYESPQIGFVMGRHLTTHLKTELEISTTSEGQQFVPQTIAVPGIPYPVFVSTDRFTRVTAVRGALVWQLLDNQWAHPFVEIGAALAADRVRTRTSPQTVRVPDGRPVEGVPGGRADTRPVTSREAGAVVGTGAKLYVAPRLFVRGDLRLTLLPSATQVAFRGGVGIDF